MVILNTFEKLKISQTRLVVMHCVIMELFVRTVSFFIFDVVLDLNIVSYLTLVLG